MTEITNRRIALGDLELHPDNYRKHPASQIRRLQESLRTFGQPRSIVVWEREEGAPQVVAGNGITMAAREEGWTHIRADVIPPDWTPERVKAYLIADNRLAELGEDDKEQLLRLLDEIHAADPKLQAAAGYEDDELDQLVREVSEETALMTGKEAARETLAERFIVPPFSVLDARQGYWQARKQAWIGLGIQSELGRGITEDSQNYRSDYGAYDPSMGQSKRANATPGGSLRPAANLGADGKTQRGDGKGRMVNGKSPARTFGQDLMKGEHVVGENRLTWVAGDREREALDDTSRKILAAGRKKQGYPHGPTVTQNPDGTLHYRGASRDQWLEEAEGNEASGTSIFDPVLCECIYTWFSREGAAILDPFAGGSVRGIVAAYLDRKYTGIDLRQEQIAANLEQAAEIVPHNLPRYIAGDSLTDQPADQFDLIFSCPPYYDLEVYSDQPGDLSSISTYEEFLADYRKIIDQAVQRLKPDRFACFVVGDVRDKQGYYRNFVSDTIAAFQDAGAILYNEAILVTALGSLPIRAGKQFTTSRKLGKTHQNVLIFAKGDPMQRWKFGNRKKLREQHQNVLIFAKGDSRKATEAAGPVKIGGRPLFELLEDPTP